MDRMHIGTKLCGLVCGAVGALIALMLLFLGFWRTLFVCALFGAGYFFGATTQKAEAVRKMINRLFPPKNE